jgi:hypothetical protein
MAGVAPRPLAPYTHSRFPRSAQKGREFWPAAPLYGHPLAGALPAGHNAQPGVTRTETPLADATRPSGASLLLSCLVTTAENRKNTLVSPHDSMYK